MLYEILMVKAKDANPLSKPGRSSGPPLPLSSASSGCDGPTAKLDLELDGDRLFHLVEELGA